MKKHANSIKVDELKSMIIELTIPERPEGAGAPWQAMTAKWMTVFNHAVFIHEPLLFSNGEPVVAQRQRIS